MLRVFWASGSSEVAISKSGKASKRVYRENGLLLLSHEQAITIAPPPAAIVCRLRSCVYESPDRLCNTLR